MKKVLLKRIFASTLAGALVLSLPVTAMAAAGGEGGTEGEASVVGGMGDFFSIVLPTNTASNVNFQVDPNQYLSNPNIMGTSADNYQKSTRLYFSRVDYDSLAMGNLNKNADYYWGSVVNTEGGYQYGNTSNWMTITNKSAKPVTVELSVNWSKTRDVEIVPSLKALADSKVAAIFMEVEASEGRTDDYYDYQLRTMNDGSPVLPFNYTYQSLDADRKTITVSPETVGDRELAWAYRPDESKALVAQKLPVVTQKAEQSTLTWVIPTVNQAYNTLHGEASYRAVDRVIGEDPTTKTNIVKREHQPYYMNPYYKEPESTLDGRQEATGVELWNNRKETYTSAYAPVYDLHETDPTKYQGRKSNVSTAEPFSPVDSFEGYDNSINVYPTYGFRLHGEANGVGWGDVEEMPMISLSWKVTIGEPDEAIVNVSPLVWDGVSNIKTDKVLDITGVIDDNQLYKVDTLGTTLRSIDVKAIDATTDADGNKTETVTYEKKDLWADGVSEIVDTTGFLNIGKQPMVTVEDLDGKVDYKTTEDTSNPIEVHINQIMLLNYSQAQFFTNRDDLERYVQLTFNFETEKHEMISATVTLLDSMNWVN